MQLPLIHFYPPSSPPPGGAPEPSRRATDRLPSGSVPAILVVDDSDQDLDLVRAAFEELKVAAHLRFVQGGRDAQAYLEGRLPYADRKQHPLPALILLDIQMPDLDGFAILRWLRAQAGELRRVPVVMFSTSSQSEDMDRAYELGANSYLVKPTTFDDLMSLLDETARYWLGRNENA